MKKVIWILILGLLFITLLIGMVGCRTAKKTQTTELLTVNSSTVEKSRLDSVVKQSYLYTDKSDIIFNPVKLIRDTLLTTEPCPENKVTYRVNGDVEVSGNIQHFSKQSTIELSRIDSLSKALEKEKKNIRTELKTETILKRKAVLWFLWLLIPAFLLGLFIGVKYHSKF